MTFFKKREHHFQPIRADGKIDTMPFLLAAEDNILPFFDVMGSTAFYPVKSDIAGNITKLTKKYELDPEKYSTLQDMVDCEIEAKTITDKGSATDALIWLKRALQFIHGFVQNLLDGVNDGESLRPCAMKSYDANLKPYHGWMVQNIFSLITRAVPNRKDFIEGLAQGEKEEAVLDDLREFLVLFGKNIDVIVEMYKSKDLDMQFKV
ncbi:glycolipid transfer protein-like [Saccoglossus kowalevskii]|uniref:Glycolipid transfer protein-like n=1 Tax=Saccoglossus kowalevskii TaxID=10224 RepID=A0ABM0GNX2_SACKO|nr:PREDICTED: glycolipid transfer protein-like [Saccoglossus kowalevskii]